MKRKNAEKLLLKVLTAMRRSDNRDQRAKLFNIGQELTFEPQMVKRKDVEKSIDEIIGSEPTVEKVS